MTQLIETRDKTKSNDIKWLSLRCSIRRMIWKVIFISELENT